MIRKTEVGDRGRVVRELDTRDAGSRLQFHVVAPDHGTGFDIAGQGTANGDSFREALRLACDVRRHRLEHRDFASNPLEIAPPKPEYRSRR